MLDLGDFVHLPEIEPLIAELVSSGSGLTLVAGLDPRPLLTQEGVLPSGRSTLFRILMRMILQTMPDMTVVTVAEDNHAVRVPRAFRTQTQHLQVDPPYTYASRIAEAVRRDPDLIVIDRLYSESARAALDAAHQGCRVLSQLDTVFTGGNVARQLLDVGAEVAQIAALHCVLAVQRYPMLCPHCRQPLTLTPERMNQLIMQLPDGEDLETSTFFAAEGCAHCDQTGRRGDVMVFDFFRPTIALDTTPDTLIDEPSLLPAQVYAWRLAQRGDLALTDVEHFSGDQLHRTYNLLTASEHALSEVNLSLERKITELQAANVVMEQRTRALISLQEISQSLITSTALDELAGVVCRYARELCGGDRAILYLLRSPDVAEVIAAAGWGVEALHAQVSADIVCDAAHDAPAAFIHWPPGVPSQNPAVDRLFLRAGLRVPLIAQGERVGVMIVHALRKARFEPGEIALLQTFANQAALAIQRASLIDDLRAKIAALEAAQAELAQKERMERELELARQVQQSVLPRTFPQIPGYSFAAHNVPARQVGGDFYDVIVLDDDNFGVAIADVSDKGMPAALYMALTRSLLLAEARRALSPAAVLATVNALLLELGEPDMFVTVFYGVIARRTGRMTFVRAGHDRPILLRDGTAETLVAKGVALGLFPNEGLRLDEAQLDLHAGDRLVLYTDGMTDVPDPAGQLLKVERFTTLLQRHAALSPAPLCRAVFEDLAAYQQNAAQFDDMTMLVLAVDWAAS
jgi:serine phosphatase RsbU (regulator of sigma subunit)